MRKLIVVLLAGACFASCNGPAQKAEAKADTVAATAPAAASKPIAGKITMDPVCEMPFDTSWTELTVYNNDTVKFCSDNCKKAFLARPEKYIKKN